jgi:hypothetical protein
MTCTIVCPNRAADLGETINALTSKMSLLGHEPHCLRHGFAWGLFQAVKRHYLGATQPLALDLDSIDLAALPIPGVALAHCL